MKYLANWVVLDSYVSVSIPGEGRDKNNEMSGKLGCTGLCVTVSMGGGQEQ